VSIITKVMPSFEGVAAGQTATAKLPIGLSYHNLLLTYTGVTLAQMTEIRLVVNGKVRQRWVGADKLDIVNQFEGQAAAAGVLNIPVGDRYGLKTRAGIEFTKLGTGKTDDAAPITSLHVEIDIDAAATAPALSMIARQSDPDYSGMVKHVREFNYNPSAAGEFDIADLPKGHVFNQLVFKSANIDKIEIQRDGYTVFERTKAENDKVQGDGVRIPQSGYFVVDFTEEGYGSEGLTTQGVHDLRVKLTMSAGGAVPLTLVSLAGIGD